MLSGPPKAVPPKKKNNYRRKIYAILHYRPACVRPKTVPDEYAANSGSVRRTCLERSLNLYTENREVKTLYCDRQLIRWVGILILIIMDHEIFLTVVVLVLDLMTILFV